MKCPCQGCRDRTVGCHSNCAAYLSWAEERRRINRAMQDARDIEHDIMAMHAESVKRVRSGQDSRRRKKREGKS